MRSMSGSRLVAQSGEAVEAHEDQHACPERVKEIEGGSSHQESKEEQAQLPTLLEGLLANKLPRRLFDVLLTYDERDVLEVPGIGRALRDHLKDYYEFRQRTLAAEQQLFMRIGKLVSVRFAAGWRIYLKYAIMRFAGGSQEDIVGCGDFLNYSITWGEAERVFTLLNGEAEAALALSDVLQIHQHLCDTVRSLVPNEAVPGAV